MRASSTLSLRLRTPESCGLSAGSRIKALFRRRSHSDVYPATEAEAETETTHLLPPILRPPDLQVTPPTPSHHRLPRTPSHRRAVSWSTSIPSTGGPSPRAKDSVRSTFSAPTDTPVYTSLRARLAGFLPLLSALAASHRRLLSATGSKASAHDGLFAALTDGIHASDMERRCLALEVARLERELERERAVNGALRERMDVLEMGVAGAVYHAAADVGWLVDVVEGCARGRGRGGGGGGDGVVGEARRVAREWETRAGRWIDERDDSGVWDDEDF